MSEQVDILQDDDGDLLLIEKVPADRAELMAEHGCTHADLELDRMIWAAAYVSAFERTIYAPAPGGRRCLVFPSMRIGALRAEDYKRVRGCSSPPSGLTSQGSRLIPLCSPAGRRRGNRERAHKG